MADANSENPLDIALSLMKNLLGSPENDNAIRARAVPILGLQSEVPRVPCMGDLRCEAPMIVGIRSSWRESRSIKVSRNRGRTSQAAFTMIDSYRAASLFRSDVIANS